VLIIPSSWGSQLGGHPARISVVGRGGRAAEQIWWLTGFPSLVGETDGDAYGRRALVGGVNVAVFTYLPASSRGTLDLVFRIGDGGAIVSCSLLGASLLRWNRPGRPVVRGGRRCWAAVGAPSTCKERRMSHFGLSRPLGEALNLLFWGCCSPLVLSRSANRLMADQVDAMVFGEHCERCRSSSPAVCLVCSVFWHVVCVVVLRCGFAVVQGFAWFPYKPSSVGLLTVFLLINEFGSSPANIQINNNR
jgi:hypothetical protein